MQKIAILNTQMEAAGAQKALLTLAKLLQEQGHTVQVITMYDKGDFVVTFRRQYDVNIIDLEMKRTGDRNPVQKLWRPLRGQWKLYRLLRQERYDVLQSFSHYSNILGPIMGWLARVPTRVTSQRMSLKDAPSWLLWADRVVTNSFLVATMVTVSDGTRQFCIEDQGINPNKLLTIHNSIDTAAFAPVSLERKEQLRRDLKLPTDALIVTTVARLHPQKGHQFLLEAIPHIVERHPEVRFLWIGDGKMRGSLEAQIKEQDLDTKIQLLGVRQDISDLLALSDLFVLPSLWEGLPNAVLEAMASGLPVVATAVDGTPEVVEDGITGILTRPKEAGPLAEAICQLLSDQQGREEMGRAGRERAVREFSQSRNIKAFEALYAQLETTGRPLSQTVNHLNHGQ